LSTFSLLKLAYHTWFAIRKEAKELANCSSSTFLGKTTGFDFDELPINGEET